MQTSIQVDQEAAIVTALIPAAGQGARMGGQRKQYRDLGGAPLVVRTLSLFEKHPRVDHIVVAAPAGETGPLSDELRTRGFRKLHAVVAGGATRQSSVAAALEAVPADTKFVLVHDAVRPFVPPGCIDAVIEAAWRKGAAALAVPVSDTLRSVSDGAFGETLERRHVWRMQTPQAFRRVWLEEAHRVARDEGHEASDETALVQRLGHRIATVAGSVRNIKITSPDDWDLAQKIWASTRQTRPRDA